MAFYSNDNLVSVIAWKPCEVFLKSKVLLYISFPFLNLLIHLKTTDWGSKSLHNYKNAWSSFISVKKRHDTYIFWKYYFSLNMSFFNSSILNKPVCTQTLTPYISTNHYVYFIHPLKSLEQQAKNVSSMLIYSMNVCL